MNAAAGEYRKENLNVKPNIWVRVRFWKLKFLLYIIGIILVCSGLLWEQKQDNE